MDYLRVKVVLSSIPPIGKRYLDPEVISGHLISSYQMSISTFKLYRPTHWGFADLILRLFQHAKHRLHWLAQAVEEMISVHKAAGLTPCSF